MDTNETIKSTNLRTFVCILHTASKKFALKVCSTIHIWLCLKSADKKETERKIVFFF